MEKQEHEFVERKGTRDRRRKSSERLTYVPLPTPSGSTDRIKGLKNETVPEDVAESEKAVFEPENSPEIENDTEKEITYLGDLGNTKKAHIRAPELIGNREPVPFTKVSLPKISVPQSNYGIQISNIEETAETIVEKIKLETEIERGRVETDVDRWAEFAEKLEEEIPILFDILYLMSAVPKDVNSVRNGHYTKDHLWNAVRSNLKLSYDISDTHLNSFGDKLFSEIHDQMKTNPLYLHEVEDLVYGMCENKLNENTFEIINSMTVDEQKIVLTYIFKPFDSWRFEEWLNNFDRYFKGCFDEGLTTDVLETLEKSTLLLKDSTHGQTQYKTVSYLSDISDELKESIQKSIGIDLSQIKDTISNIDEEIKLEEEVERGRVEPDIRKWKDAIDRLKEEDFILVDMLYTVASTGKGITAVNKGYYTTHQLWDAVKENLTIRYGLTHDQFQEYKEKLHFEIQNKLKTNLLYLFSAEETLIYEIIKDDLIEHIINNIKNMSDVDKRAVLCYLINPLDFYGDNSHEVFNKHYKICFGEDYIGDIEKTLTKANILVYGIWITAKGGNNGAEYRRPDSFPEISEHVKKCIVDDLQLDITDIERKLSEATNKIDEVEEEQTETREEGKEILLGSEIAASQEDSDIFEEFVIKSSTGNFPRNISNDKPVVILLSKSADDDYGTTVNVFARELFKELAGGLPTGRIWSKGDRDIERDTQAEDHIEFIDNTNTEYFESSISKIKNWKKIEESVNWTRLGDRLQELIYQGFGFIIFQIQEEIIDDFKEKIEELTGDKKPQIIVLHPQFEGSGIQLTVASDGKSVYKEDLIEIKKEISKSLWGFVNPVEDDRWQRGKSFDNFFSACESKFDTELKKIGTTPIKIGSEKITPSVLVEDGENESNIHHWMKVFVYKYLIDKKNYSKESIETEKEFNGVIPDIKVKDIVIEIETLFGTGRPVNKITQTIKKYSDKNVEVWIVIKNVDVFFHYPELMRLKKNVKDEFNINLEIFTLDVENRDLVSIADVKNRIRPSQILPEQSE